MKYVGTANLFATTKSKDSHPVVENWSQRGRLAHRTMELEDVVERMFVEEHTALHLEEIDKLGQLEGLGGITGVEGEDSPSPSIQ